MFVPFVYELRARKVPVGAQEVVALADALKRGLHESSLDGFYHVSRALLVHSEAHLDAFDEAFLSAFKGMEKAGIALHSELLKWLEEAIASRRQLTPEEQALLERFTPDELRKMLEERLREQKERHDGGNRWIGTGGTSPFGNSGAAREGIRVGGAGGNRSAINVASARNFKGYRTDLTLEIRQTQVALRKLRGFTREGVPDELDLDATIDETARNAGELEVVTRPQRRPNVRVLLLMDVGGSMDPYADLVSRLFTAACKATHWKELRSYYFHNCVYGRLYKTEAFRDPVDVHQVIAETGPHWKLIFVGDALMAPYELLSPGGALYLDEKAPANSRGLDWLHHLQQHYERSAWLNPEPVENWSGNTIEAVRSVFAMFPLTVQGLDEAVAHLTRGGKGARR